MDGSRKPPARRPRALLYGVSTDLMRAPPTLLARAGFAVTLLTSNRRLRRCRNVAHRIEVERRADVAARAVAEARNGYDLVVACDDHVLHDVMLMQVPVADKLRVLPVTSERGLAHIASKIGLSRVLTEAGVTTPAYAVAEERSRLPVAIARLGYPVVVKTDFSMGGSAVVALRSPADLARLRPDFRFPAVVQRLVQGALVDCSAVFHAGELVTFSHATMLALERRGYGPSTVRSYWTRAESDPDLVATMRRFGHALDADGFVNASAIRSAADGQLYIFEADMRPNVWIEYPRFYGSDPAIALARAHGLPLPARPAAPVDRPEFVEMAYLPRLPLLDVLLNRYGCRTQFEDYLRCGIAGELLLRWITSFHPRARARRVVAALQKLLPARA